MRLHLPALRVRFWLGVTLVVLYATLIEPNWVTATHHRFGTGTAPPLRIVQITDLHLAGIGWRERRAAALITASRPDLIVITGDTLGSTEWVEPTREFLEMLPRGIPKLAILGNWEHWGGLQRAELDQIYRTAGVELLVNQAVTLATPAGVLQVVGLDDATVGAPNLEQAMRGTTRAPNRLVLQHSPIWRDQVLTRSPETWPDLILSGHTHGGQITLFGVALNLPPGSGAYQAGWYGIDTGQAPLYVSRGVGTSIIPIRFWAPPEVTVIDWQLRG